MITSLPDPSRRAVITGIGVVAPNGIGNDAWWKATERGRERHQAASPASTRPATPPSSPAR